MDLFTFNAELKVLVCQGCGYAVRHRHVKTHLLRHHQNLKNQARTIVRQAEDLLAAEDELRVEDIPTAISGPILGLLPPRDGLSCELDDRTCRYICGNVKSMKEHCRKAHQWKQRARRGRPSRIPLVSSSSSSTANLEPWRVVRYQQLFPSGPGSHFIEVTQEETISSSPTTIFRTIDQLRTEAQQATWTTIQQADPREVSPWLERTRWTTYLEGIPRAELLMLLHDPDPVRSPQEALIKTTVGEMIKFCQQSVCTTAGIFVRFEAVQSNEQRGRRKQPLVPYVHAADLDKSSRPWIHIVLFFVRVGRAPASHHPQYPLSPDQNQCLQTLLELSRTIVDDQDSRSHHGESLAPLHVACLQFCLSLLRQEVRTHEYESPFICALAVLGVTEDGWKGPDEYPSLLSALLKTSRYMFVQSAIDRTTPGSTSTLQLLRDDVSRYMFRGTFTPFDWMYELRAYGMAIAFNTNREGRVDWDGDTLLYGKLQFTMGDFRTFIHGLHHAVREILLNELLLGRTITTGVPTVLLPPLRDDLRRKTSGWCFLQDSRNHFPVDGDTWLWQQVQSRHRLRTRFFPDTANTKSWPPGVQAYFRSLSEFRTKLLLLIHLVSGQPARGTELLSVRFRNTSEGEHRNIFLEGGLINITTLWHKGYTVSGSTKPVNRFLPSEVSEDLVRYLWLIQPFIERLEVHYCHTTRLSAFLWPTEPGSSQPRKTDDVRRSLQQESYVGLGQIMNVQQYRHIAIAITRRFLSTPYQFQEHEDRTMQIREEEDHILDLQAGHTSSIAASTYARGIQEQEHEIYTMRQRYRDASIMWHDLLGFRSVRSHELTPTGAKHRLPFRDQLERDARQRQEGLRTMDHVRQLHKLVGPQAQFRILQEEALLAILAGHSPVLAIMPTGGGKSLLFQLPASYDHHGTTIVVVPLIALRYHLQIRSASYGLFASEWNPRQPPDQAQVVLVTPEAAITDRFATFLNRLRTKRQLDRIVFDECHLLLDMEGSFRPAFLQLRNLLLYDTQFIFLTATLPPTWEKDFWIQLHLEKSQLSCFRTRTTRPNISYQVTFTMDQEQDQLIRDLIQSAQPGQIIIYCRTIATVAVLTQHLQCVQYTAKSAEKDENLERFISGACRTIVATTALGLGVDVPDVSLVIHAGLPYSLIDFSQESGRAGRNQAPCQSIIVRDYQPLPDHIDEPLRRFVSSSQCRRRILDEYLDGIRDRTKCVPPEVLCDRCQPALIPPPVLIPATRHSPPPQRLQGRFVRDGFKREGLQLDEALQVFQRLCSSCFLCLNQQEQLHAHRPEECKQDPALRQSYEEAVSLVQRTIQIQKYAGCFFCGLPQSTCTKWEAQDSGGYRIVREQSCRFPQVLWRGLAGMLIPCQVQEAKQQQVQHKAVQARLDRTTAGMIQFFGRKVQMGPWETNQGVRQFLSYYGSYVRKG